MRENVLTWEEVVSCVGAVVVDECEQDIRRAILYLLIIENLVQRVMACVVINGSCDLLRTLRLGSSFFFDRSSLNEGQTSVVVGKVARAEHVQCTHLLK